MILQYGMNRRVDGVINSRFEGVALDKGNWADGNKRYQRDFAENEKENEFIS